MTTLLIQSQSVSLTVNLPAIKSMSVEPDILENPETVSGEPELPGFVLRMAKIW